MKKTLLTLAFPFLACASYAQGSAGLIAHWNMNGSVNDVSGNGHDGTANNITPAVGVNGIMGDAYHFNGSNSSITVPYSAAFNLTKYSICATVKVAGFYTGTCQANMVITRGEGINGAAGSWGMLFFDNAFDNNNCTAFDSTEETFAGMAGAANSSSMSVRYYTPTIMEDQWYKVVITYNDSEWKIYVNDTLKNTTLTTTPGASMGTSTDSVSIGYNIFGAAGGFPCPLNGDIDDISIYNRVLSDSDIAVYTTAVPQLSVEPQISIYPNPVTKQLNVSSTDKITKIAVSNVLGQMVFTNSYNTHDAAVDLSALPSGVYFVKVNDTIVKKFTKL